MAFTRDPEWASDPATQAFLQEILGRRQRLGQRLLALCKQGDSLLDIRYTAGQHTALGELATLIEGDDAENTDEPKVAR